MFSILNHFCRTFEVEVEFEFEVEVEVVNL